MMKMNKTSIWLMAASTLLIVDALLLFRVALSPVPPASAFYETKRDEANVSKSSPAQLTPMEAARLLAAQIPLFPESFSLYLPYIGK